VPLGNVYSVGDIAIGLGVLATLVIAMRPPLVAGWEVKLMRLTLRLRDQRTLHDVVPDPEAVPSAQQSLAELLVEPAAIIRREAVEERRDGRERGILAAAADLRRQREALAERELRLEQREAEFERRALQLREDLAAASAVAEPNVAPVMELDAPWNLETLERLTLANAEAFPERADEWRYTLLYLRNEARVDGTLPRSFDPVVVETFGELLDAA
jgi:hypothetical protein